MTYKTLLFDIDDTLLDFKAAETYAISKLIAEAGLEVNKPNIEQYKVISQNLWEEHEKGTIERSVLLGKRFEDFFGLHGINVNGQDIDAKFRTYLAEEVFLIDGSMELLASLVETHDVYAVTNGVSKTQHQRLSDTGMNAFFKAIFVSEDTGYQKPMPEYFDYVFRRIPNLNLEETLIIGDSLTSDITGGALSGIDTCWFNPHKMPNPLEITPTHVIESLKELPAIVLGNL